MCKMWMRMRKWIRTMILIKIKLQRRMYLSKMQKKLKKDMKVSIMKKVTKSLRNRKVDPKVEI